jgi:hypothetical protein
MSETKGGPTGWRELLVVAVDSFFLQPPGSWLEGMRRFAVVIALIMLSGGTYIIAREPQIIHAIAGRPLIEQSITKRMRSVGKDVERAMETWFYQNRPRGLMLIAWDELATLRGVWVKPESAFSDRIGIREIATEIRDWAGPFIFGECVVQDYPEMPGTRIAACPILNDFDVWGYIAVVYHPRDMSDSRAMTLLRHLTRQVTEHLY